ESLLREARRMFTVFGPLWLIAPLALRDMSYARRGLALVLMSLVAMTFALDWGRMILLAAPVFYPAAAHVLAKRRRWWLPTLRAVGSPALTVLSRPRWSMPSSVGTKTANSAHTSRAAKPVVSARVPSDRRGVTPAASTRPAPAARKNGQTAPHPRPSPNAEAI